MSTKETRKDMQPVSLSELSPTFDAAKFDPYRSKQALKQKQLDDARKRSNTFMYAREVSRQTTKAPANIMPNMFDTDTDRQNAIELQKSDSLLFGLADGIAPYDLKPYQVIAALQILYYRQNEALGDTRELTASTQDFAESIQELNIPKYEFTLTKDIWHGKNEIAEYQGQKLKKGARVRSMFGIIITTLSELTEVVNGGRKPKIHEMYGITAKEEVENSDGTTTYKDKTVKVSHADGSVTIEKVYERKGVKQILDDMQGKKVIIDTGETYVLDHLIKTTEQVIKATGERILVISLSPVFTKLISLDGVRDRIDRLRLLSGVSVLEWRLYEVLINQLSLKHGLYGISKKPYRVRRENLLDRVAILPSYKPNPSRKYKDFDKAIEHLKEIKLIKKYGAPQAPDGGIMCDFWLNPDYYTADLSAVGDTPKRGRKKQAAKRAK